jgi:DNA polymerase
MFIGEAPGAREDETGLPFVGAAGKFLDDLLRSIGLSRDTVYICNVVKCRPPGNRDPLPDEIFTCRPYLEAQLDLLQPKVVVTLGNFATKLLLDTKVGITKLRGQEHPYRDSSTVLIPMLHPAAVLRNGGAALAQARADFVVAKRALARSNPAT